jgi:hypothetical protein
MPVLPPSPVEMNRRYSEFWAAENQNFERRLGDTLIRAIATEVLESESARSVQVYSRITLESALAKAEELTNKIRSADGSRGGRPRRNDALQSLIEEIVAKNPKITDSLLLERIRLEQFGGIVEDVDDREMHFKHGEDESRSAPISGLKDRLSRARKSLNSRKPVSAKP